MSIHESPGTSTDRLGHRLLQLGMFLFLVGLLTGFAIPSLANPRMGLASHLEGVMNGILLMVLGLVWPRLRLGSRAKSWAFALAIFASFVNWAATLLAAAWNAGGGMMPIAAPGRIGTPWQETAIAVLLVALSIAMVAACALVLWGLRLGKQRASS